MFRDILIYISAYIGLFAVSFYFLSLISRIKEKHPTLSEDRLPKVSIIIPAFNEEKGIGGSIKFALNIDYPKSKLEIIVVDDGSKDNTYNVAKSYKNKIVRVFKLRKNKGKGAAINFGLDKAKGEIVVTMDADNTIVKSDVLKNMVAYFQNPKVMCVSPIIAIYKPKGILQRVQQVEYLLGVFLRKAFSSVNAVHITPGAFSSYRKRFFDKYGGFDEKNLTEDMEVALRIQKNQFIIENSLESVVYTVAPNKFFNLLKQRRRWYTGLLKNLWNYRMLFSKEYGVMGTIVLPIAIITIILSVILTSYLLVNTIIQVKKEILLLKSINFDFASIFELNKFAIERFFFILFSNPVTSFFLLFIFILGGYMIFSKTKVKEHSNIKLSIFLFSFIYAFLFAFWWIISFVYALFGKKVSWR